MTETRRPTFLARIRRRTKIAFVFCILAIFCVPAVAPSLVAHVMPVRPSALLSLPQTHHQNPADPATIAPQNPENTPPVADKKPARIAVVVLGVDLDHDGTRLALENLPTSVAIALDPQGATSAEAFRSARDYGHDTLVDLPMQPSDYPESDTGANTLLVGLPKGALRDRLAYLLSQTPADIVGVTTSAGDAFLADSESRTRLFAFLQTRKILFADPIVESDPPTSVSPVSVSDSAPTSSNHDSVRVIKATLNLGNDPVDPNTLDAALAQLETTAHYRGSAVLFVRPWPTTLARLKLWLAGLNERGFVLTPLHELAP